MIHQYKLHGFNIVLDIASGAIHVVDEVAYDMIALYEAHTREQVLSETRARYEGRDGITAEDIAECYGQIGELKARGKLFSEDTFAPMAGKLKEKTAGVVKALCLQIGRAHV